MNRFILAIFLLLIFECSLAEESRGYLNVDLSTEADSSENRDFSLTLLLLDKPNGKPIGSIELEPFQGQNRFRLPFIAGKPIDFNQHDSWRTDAWDRLKYYELSNIYARVLAESSQRELWLKLIHDDDTSNRRIILTPTPWPANGTANQSGSQSGSRSDDQSTSQPNQFWQQLDYHRYRLRTAPTTSSKAIITLSESQHLISHGTGRTSGAWAEVVVRELVSSTGVINRCEPPLGQQTTNQQWTGWLKVLTENGEPRQKSLNDAC